MRVLWPGVPLALASALLFGAVAPASKLLLGSVSPQLLAGLLYLGAGVGLALVHLARGALGLPAQEARLRRSDLPWLAAVDVFTERQPGDRHGRQRFQVEQQRARRGLGPCEAKHQQQRTHHAAGQHDRRLLLGAAAILAGAVVLSWRGQGVSLGPGAALIAAACLAWGIDNNLTRKLSAADPVVIAMAKGLVAGAVNTGLAIGLGAALPAAGTTAAAAIVGFLGIGVSLVAFVLALRHLGAARTGAYFSLAPFIGALIAVVALGETMTPQLLVAGALMATGLWLHLAERHGHEHEHEGLEHDHVHTHDDHHQHAHDGPVTEPHSHWHRHARLRHAQPHYPDLHHRHRHP
jgi:drug/metabolite transporter (DMT)-like permease